METISCPFTNYCGEKGRERACDGNHPRTVRCFHCGRTFRSSCGARLFCSGKCQEESEFGQKIIHLIHSGRMEEVKREKRKAQLHLANKKWRETPKGIAAKKAQDARRYERIKAKVAAAQEAVLPDTDPALLEEPVTVSLDNSGLNTTSDAIPGDRIDEKIEPVPETNLCSSAPTTGPDFDPKTIPGDQDPEKMESFFGENAPIPCIRPGCGNSFDFDAHVPQKKYCSRECYDIVHLAKKRLLHWYDRTGCLYAREIYRLLRDEAGDSG